MNKKRHELNIQKQQVRLTFNLRHLIDLAPRAKIAGPDKPALKTAKRKLSIMSLYINNFYNRPYSYEFSNDQEYTAIRTGNAYYYAQGPSVRLTNVVSFKSGKSKF